MPHLMLEFTADRAVKEVGGKSVPTGQDTIFFRVMDTATGKVVELRADVKNIKQAERQPTWGETRVATETLGKPLVGTYATKEEYEKAKAEMESYRQKLLSAQAELVQKNSLIVGLNDKVKELQEDHVPDGKEIIGRALDGYIEELAASQRFEEYEKSKRVYRRLTGQKWVEDGESDEEADLSAHS